MNPIFVILWFGFFAYSQTSHKLVNQVNQKTIPYGNIWLFQKDYGTTTNRKGEFIIPKLSKKDSLVIDVVGYERKIIDTDSLRNLILLKPISNKSGAIQVPKTKIVQKYLLVVKIS